MIFHVSRESMIELLKNNKRIDERGLYDYRKIKINKNVVPKAEGSAEVFLGNTHVIAGVKMDLGTPFPDRPDEGVLITNAEFVPLASPDFEPGSPKPDSIEMARVVDRAIRESKAIDTKSLCIEPGKKVWTIFVDIYVIDYDGNLIGINSAKIRAYLADNVSYAIKSSYLKNLIDVLPTTLSLPNDKTIINKTLTEKIKIISDYVVLIRIK